MNKPAKRCSKGHAVWGENALAIKDSRYKSVYLRCRRCNNMKAKLYRIRNKEHLNNHKLSVLDKRRRKWMRGKSCVVCGATRKLWIYPRGDFNWSKTNTEAVANLNKIAKVYCREHYVEKRRDAVKVPMEHGTFSGYRTHNCRCQACKDVYNAYVRANNRKRNRLWGLRKRGPKYKDPVKLAAYAQELIMKLGLTSSLNTQQGKNASPKH